jgi:6-phosphogluconolactonase
MSVDLYKPNITDFETEAQFLDFAETFVLDEMLENIGEEGSFRLALCGGSTPLPLYYKLGANQSLPWEEVELYQTDERFVPTTDQESNQFHIKESFGEDTLRRIKEAYFMDTNLGEEECLEQYDQVLNSLEDPLFDLTILGLGEDGHFASLFPNSSYLGHQETHVVGTLAGPEFTTGPRVSLTVESILNSKKILILLNGANKESVLAELIGGSMRAAEFPAKFLLAHPKVFVLSYFAQDIEKEQEESDE